MTWVNSDYTTQGVCVRGCKLGHNVHVVHPSNVYDAELGDNVFVGPFVEIQHSVVIGARTRIQSHACIAAGTQIGSDCFIGHGVVTCNDRNPIANNKNFELEPVIVGISVSIGSNAVICAGVRIGDGALVGAGAVVTRNVEPYAVVVGNPARFIKWRTL